MFVARSNLLKSLAACRFETTRSVCVSSVQLVGKHPQVKDHVPEPHPAKENKARKVTVGHNEKEAKLISFRSKIEDHDLESKINHIKKWLKKGIPVKASIMNTESTFEKCEEIYSKISKQLSAEAKLAQKQQAGKEIKFVIEPKETPSS